MNASFVVTLTNLQPDENLTAIAEEIGDNLSDEFIVVSVNPWERPVTGAPPAIGGQGTATVPPVIPPS